MGEEGDGRPDMVNRDPNALNDNLMVRFEDVIGEPDSAHTPDCAYKCGFDCYECGMKICYKLLAFLCTWAYGLCWGCGFAMATFGQVWIFSPCSRCFGICIGCTKSYVELICSCIVAPYCSALGMFFSNIKVSQSSG